MSKRYFQWILLLLLLCATNVAWGWSFKDPYPWGVSYRVLSSTERGLVRSYSGLDAFQRTRIARFCKDQPVLQAPARVYYSFKSNHLYEVEIDFKRPDKELFSRVFSALNQQFGAAGQLENGERPIESPFSQRSYSDMVWTSEHSRVNLRYTENTIGKKQVIQSLFITYRAQPNAGGDQPRLLMSDNQLKGTSAQNLVLSYTGAIIVDRYKSDSRKQNLKTKLAGTDLLIGAISGRQSGGEVAAAGSAKLLEFMGYDLLVLLSPEFWESSRSTIDAFRRELSAHKIRYLRPTIANAAKAAAVAIETKGIRLGFIGYSLVEEQSRSWTTAVKEAVGMATNDVTTISFLNYEKRIQKDIKQLQAVTDYVIVMLHWPQSEEACPTFIQRRAADLALQANASLVLGQHPEEIQPIVEQKNKLILFSAGNLNSTSSEKGKESLIFSVSLTKMGIAGYDFKPVRMDGSSDNGSIIRFLDGEEKRRALDEFTSLCRGCTEY